MESGLFWKSVLGEIELNISPSVYATWFKKTRLLSRSADELVVGVPNVFTQKQLETQFKPLVKKALAKNKADCRRISYRVVSSGKNVAPAVRQNAGRVESGSGSWSQNYRFGLNGRYTFDSFIPGPGNDLAYAAARAVADNLGKKYNPLFIYGGVGIGKTHLIQAIGNEVSNRDAKLKVVYVTVEQFVQEFTDAIRYKQSGAFSNKYRSTDVLIIDDIQFIANKEKTQEEFFHTFNILHESGRQIIISSDKPPTSIPTLEERLKSRFQMGMLIDMQVPDFETRCAILKSKAEALNLKIEHDCIEFLAGNVSTNIRVLEGVLNQLNAVREINRVELITLQLAKRIFDDRFKKAAGRLTAKKIIEKTADHYQVDIDELLGPKRDKEIVLPRQIAMYLMRRELHSSFPKIAHSLGRKDHTTAIHSIGKIEKQLVYNEDLRESLVRIKESLAA